MLSHHVSVNIQILKVKEEQFQYVYAESQLYRAHFQRKKNYLNAETEIWLL